MLKLASIAEERELVRIVKAWCEWRSGGATGVAKVKTKAKAASKPKTTAKR